MNVLGTPPAFILSQDQTLWIIVLKPMYLYTESNQSLFSFCSLLCKSIFLISVVSGYLPLYVILKRNCRDSLHHISKLFALYFALSYLVCYSIFKDQVRRSLSATCIYYHISSVLSTPFFNFFQNFFQGDFCYYMMWFPTRFPCFLQYITF